MGHVMRHEGMEINMAVKKMEGSRRRGRQRVGRFDGAMEAMEMGVFEVEAMGMGECKMEEMRMGVCEMEAMGMGVCEMEAMEWECVRWK